MIFLIISILCSVTVAVLLKLARRYHINVMQAVTWNYLFAMLLGAFFFKPDYGDLLPSKINLVYLLLGILLPVIFWFLAASVRNIGIVRTDIAQRLSLIIPLLAAYFLFGDRFGSLKIIGLLIGFSAIILVLYKKGTNKIGKSWIYPIIVFAGFGIIDVLFKKVAQIKEIPYTSSLMVIFFLAFILSLIFILYAAIVNKKKIELVNFGCGAILGFFNFFNILFYLKAHRVMADQPSTVFAAMNLGVIVVGSLVGILIFKEKLTRLNIIGLFMALIAILLITLGQLYAI